MLDQHCRTCRCPREAELGPAESLEDQSARVKIMEIYGLGTASVPPFDQDPFVIPPARLSLVPARPTLVVLAGRRDRGGASVRLVALVAAAGLLVGLFASGVSDQQMPLWVAIIGYATSTLIGLVIGREPRRPGITPIIPEHVAEVRKMHASARINVAVLRNGQLLAERVIDQKFNGETLGYEIEVQPSGQLAKRETITLALTTHVIHWERIGAPLRPTTQPPFIGGTREGS